MALCVTEHLIYYSDSQTPARHLCPVPHVVTVRPSCPQQLHRPMSLLSECKTKICSSTTTQSVEVEMNESERFVYQSLLGNAS